MSLSLVGFLLSLFEFHWFPHVSFPLPLELRGNHWFPVVVFGSPCESTVRGNGCLEFSAALEIPLKLIDLLCLSTKISCAL